MGKKGDGDDSKKKGRKRKTSKAAVDETGAVGRKRKKLEEEKGKSGRSVQIYRCGFVKWDVQGIVAATSGPKNFGVVRANGNMEVYDLSRRSSVVGAVPGDGTQITCMAIYEGHILAGSLNGYIRVVDYQKRTIRRNIDSQGGAVWCMMASPKGHDIAFGCESGAVGILQREKREDFSIVKTLPRGNARVTCVSWSADGKYLIAGDAAGSLRKFDVQSSRCIETGQISLPKEDITIWNILQYKDVVISGDSRGVTTIWNADMMLAEKELHVEGLAGDIFSLCRLDDAVFIGAANGGVGVIERTEEGGWVSHRGRRIHNGDVRAIVPYGFKEKVIACGADSLITLHTRKSFLGETIARTMKPSIAPFGSTFVKVQQNSVLAIYDDIVQLWELPSPELLGSKPKLLVRIRPGDLGGRIVTASVSADLKSLAISGPKRMQLFTIKKDETCELQGVRTQLIPMRSIKFYGMNDMACVSADGTVLHLLDKEGRQTAKWSVVSLCKKNRSPKIAMGVRAMDARNDGRIVVLDTSGQTTIIDSPKGGVIPSVRTKATKATHIALHPTKDILAYVDKKKLKLMDFSQRKVESAVVPLPQESDAPPAGVDFVASCDCWLVYGRDFAILISADFSSTDGKKKKKVRPKVRKLPLDRSCDILGFGEVEKDTLAVVERPFDKVLHTIPSMPRKLFAT